MLIQQSAIYVFARLLVGLIAMATTAMLTRLLTPVTYGKYALALVVMAFGAQTLFNWITVSFARLYQARSDDPKTLSTFAQIFALTAAGGAAAFLAAWSAGVLSGDTARAYGVGLLLMWSYAWFELLSGFEVVSFRPGTYLYMCLGRAILILFGACGAAWLTGGPLWTALGYGFGMFAASWLGRTRGWSLRPSRFDRALAGQICRFGLPLAGCMALSALSTSGTRLLVNELDSAEALGLFTAAYVIVQSTLGVIAFGVVAAGYQLAVKAVEAGDEVAARRQLVANVALLYAVIAPAALGMALTADGLAQTVVGPKFSGAMVELIPLMAAGQFFESFRSCYLDHAFQLGKKSSFLAWIMGITAAVSLGLGVWLIPVFGPMGAAIAMAVAAAVSCGLDVVLGRYAYPMPIPYGVLGRLTLACAAMAAVVLSLRGSGPVFLGLQVVLGALTYGAAVLALDVMDARALVSRRLRRVVAGYGRA
jgi:O-antigen/teichoic acid export membrane protein